MLILENVRVSYGSIEALHGINLSLSDGEIVSIIGANGAGKTTTLRAIAGLVAKARGSSIRFQEEEISGFIAEKIVSKGISLVPEGRRIFPELTILENLEMGAYLRSKEKTEVHKDMQKMFEYFPSLEARKSQQGKTLSGGELQMLSIARALMARPRILMLDEPSTGLAPIIVKSIFDILRDLNAAGMSILLVEQNAKLALGISDRGYVLKNGDIILEDTGENLLKNDAVRTAYLGEKLGKENSET